MTLSKLQCPINTKRDDLRIKDGLNKLERSAKRQLDLIGSLLCLQECVGLFDRQFTSASSNAKLSMTSFWLKHPLT